MGNGYEIRCEACGREDQFLLGRGFLPLEDLGEIQGDGLFRTLAEHPGALFLSQRVLATCDACSEAQAVPIGEIELAGKTLYRSQPVCGSCGESVQETCIEDLVSRPCLACGAGPVVIATYIDWD